MPDEARYLYCIVHSDSAKKENLGHIGIEKQEVYTIPHRDIAAVVHSCRPVPYDSRDRRKAEEWVLEHGYVIDQAAKRYESILPFSFDVILREGDPQIERWLGRNYDLLRERLDALKDQAEYTVQIFYDGAGLEARIMMANGELNELKKRMEIESKGKAYLLSRKLDQMLKREVAAEAGRLAEEFLVRIREQSDRLVLNERTSWTPEDLRDKILLVSCSCLVHKDRVDRLGEVLEDINSKPDFRVRFTGPWAAFSFVDLRGLS